MFSLCNTIQHLHELYPLELVQLEDFIPQDGEEDFIVLNEVAERIIQKLDSVREFNFNLTQFFY